MGIKMEFQQKFCKSRKKQSYSCKIWSNNAV